MNEGQDVRIHPCNEHGDFPVHMDMVVPLEDFRMAEKIRVDTGGQIISDELIFPKSGDLER